jgi:ATP-dependent RNA helicase DHX8/PRP22
VALQAGANSAACPAPLARTLPCRGKREEAQEAHQRFLSREGDHITLLNVFRAYCDVPLGKKKGRGGGGQERTQWCRSHFVNPRALRKAADIHGQLREHLLALGILLASCGEDMQPLRRALAAGLFPHAAKRQLDGERPGLQGCRALCMT